MKKKILKKIYSELQEDIFKPWIFNDIAYSKQISIKEVEDDLIPILYDSIQDFGKENNIKYELVLFSDKTKDVLVYPFVDEFLTRDELKKVLNNRKFFNKMEDKLK